MSSKPKKFTIGGIDPFDFTVVNVGKAKIIYRNIPWSQAVYVEFLFQFGAKDDLPGKEGATHFLEHLLIAGSSKFPDKQSVKDFSQKYALNSINASTGFNLMSVHAHCLPEYFSKVADALTDMVTTSKLTEKDIEHERAVITQELWGRFKNEKHLEYIMRYRKNLYRSLPDRMRIPRPLGLPETVASIRKEDLVRIKDSFITQDNLIVFLAGKVTAKELTDIKKKISSIKTGGLKPTTFVPKTVLQPKENEWRLHYSDAGLSDGKQVSIDIVSVDAISKTKEAKVGRVAASLLWNLLQKKMRIEKSWCYSAGASFSRYADFVSTNIEADVDPAHVKDALKDIHSVIQSIIKGDEKGAFNVQKKVILDSRRALEFTTEEIMGSAIDTYSTFNKIRTMTNELRDFNHVTYADVQKFMKVTFDKKRTFTRIFYPNNVKIT